MIAGQVGRQMFSRMAVMNNKVVDFEAEGAQEGEKLPINIFEGKEDPVIGKEEEYPEWLEGVLEEASLGNKINREFNPDQEDFWAMNNKRNIKRRNMLHSKK
eukprot:TRINITY_DN2340_c0_g1_i1.p1 TRINITY_DN2340_c0_g1~~TRINITY_DN2340_c0_g1_i1.p1  ORF type:complete len:102 (-),score=47.52 TRINITY_DN2340_c0_g1_i1:807-1112(-)